MHTKTEMTGEPGQMAERTQHTSAQWFYGGKSDVLTSMGLKYVTLNDILPASMTKIVRVGVI